jgi:hypothetical protein
MRPQRRSDADRVSATIVVLIGLAVAAACAGLFLDAIEAAPRLIFKPEGES